MKTSDTSCMFANVPVQASSQLKYSTKDKTQEQSKYTAAFTPSVLRDSVQCHTTLEAVLHSWTLSHRIQTVTCSRGSH